MFANYKIKRNKNKENLKNIKLKKLEINEFPILKTTKFLCLKKVEIEYLKI